MSAITEESSTPAVTMAGPRADHPEMPEDDLLAALLSPLRLRGLFTSEWSVRAPWGIGGTGEDCALLHHVRTGRLVMTIAEHAEPVELHAGELAIFPHGTAHTLADRPGRELTPLDHVLPDRPAGSTRTVRIDGPGPATQLLCGGMHYDRTSAPSIYLHLPDVIVLDQQSLAQEPLLGLLLHQLAPGNGTLAAAEEIISMRAFELVFILALRTALTRAELPAPVLAGLRHPGISRALLAIQTRFAEPWTVQTLAREARMSRSAFAATFRRLVGTAPGGHLTERRMQEAGRLLRETSLAPGALPVRVGYGSPVGFHLAFRKHFGTTPAQFRRLAAPASR